MARGKKTGGKNFTSETAALAGAKSSKALPPELKELRSRNRRKAELILHRLFELTKSDIQEKLEDPNTTALELALCKVLVAGINRGDQSKVQFIMDRAIGPIVQKVEHEVDMNTELSLHDRVVKAIKDANE